MKVFDAFLKWLALLVFSISAALLVIILLAPRPSMDYFWLRLSMLAAVAFIGGLLARLLFHRWHGVFLFLIALFTEILALLVVDYFYESPSATARRACLCSSSLCPRCSSCAARRNRLR